MFAAIYAIAHQTVREALRRRVMWIFLVTGIFLIAMGPVFGFLSPRDSQTVLRSLGLAAILLAGLFTTIVTCIYLIPVEIERRTIYTVLSKPVQRFEFVLGKFLGGFAVVFINIAAMGVVFLAMLRMQEHQIPPEMVRGVIFTFFQMMLLAALTIFFSTFATPVVNFFLSFGIFLVGNLSSVTDTLTTSHNKISQMVGLAIHYLLPQFGNFNVQNQLIHPEEDIVNMSVYMRNNIAYALLYSAVLLALAVFIFDRREV
ncbi:MAG TPA: ABC transporter permease subunit [Chthonomonas sp.]|uniref:ABC transporter permease n=1 Tax=Chthonomonas sp. TaxID=2282153 RepID=UPI002B4AC1C7|nr:ABC transporter permease subunit [Chthonomonas sp.]HLI48981.1 ABC transporter permease subunit [Chthonomonas sp.]